MTAPTVAPQRPQDARRASRDLRRLSGLAFDSFDHPRQRERGQDYVRGLLAQPGRKSITAIAEAADCPGQSLQHFVTDSTWDTEGVARALALATQSAVGKGLALIIDDTGQAKQGKCSPGWHASTRARWGRSGTARSS